jgi:hypothetical protein
MNINTIFINITAFVGGVIQYLIRPLIITLLWNYVVTYDTDWPKITFVQSLVIFEILFRILITYFPYKMMYMTSFPTSFPPESPNDADSDDDLNDKDTPIRG